MPSKMLIDAAHPEETRVVDENMQDVPEDGETMGEVVMRGNNVMIGYYKNPEATAESFRGGSDRLREFGVDHGDLGDDGVGLAEVLRDAVDRRRQRQDQGHRRLVP